MMRSSGSVLTIAVALICIAGIGMGAATLGTADPIGADDDDQIFIPEETGQLEGPDDGPSEADGEEDRESGTADGSANTLTTCVEGLDTTAGMLGVIGAFLFVSAVTFYRYNFAMTMLLSWTLLPPVMLVYFLVTDCGPSGSAVPNVGGGGGSGAAGESLAPVTGVPPWALGLLIGTVFVGAAALLYRSMSEEEVVVPETEDEDDELAVDQFAEAAGRAADRIEKRNSDVDNSVYRAWIEMTGLLDVERPDTYSAGEFADAAVEVGMAEKDVSELTELFNEVRYGGKDATTREDRAVSILRNIESQYGSDDGEGSDPSSSTEGER